MQVSLYDCIPPCDVMGVLNIAKSRFRVKIVSSDVDCINVRQSKGVGKLLSLCIGGYKVILLVKTH